MLLSLFLLLLALSRSSQEICSAPGALPAPTLYLNQTLARPGDSVQVRCFMSSWHLATRIVFCKDGEEVSVQTGSKEKATYDYEHVVSGGSSGNFSCGYEIKDSDNQVTRSQLSHTQRLSVTGDGSSSDSDGDSFLPGLDLKLLLGIAVPAVLVLAVALCLLRKKAGSLRRAHRERVQRDPCSAPEDEYEYALVVWPGRATAPQSDKDTAGSYESLKAVTIENTPYSTLPERVTPSSVTSELCE